MEKMKKKKKKKTLVARTGISCFEELDLEPEMFFLGKNRNKTRTRGFW